MIFKPAKFIWYYCPKSFLKRNWFLRSILIQQVEWTKVIVKLVLFIIATLIF